MPRWLRWIFTTVVALLALLFWFMALTVPMDQAVAPLIISLVLTVGVYRLWPKKNKTLQHSLD